MKLTPDHIKCVLIRSGQHIVAKAKDLVSPLDINTKNIYLCLIYEEDGQLKHVIFDTDESDATLYDNWEDYLEQITDPADGDVSDSISSPLYMETSDHQYIRTPFSVRYRRPILSYPDTHQQYMLTYGHAEISDMTENSDPDSPDLFLRPAEQIRRWAPVSRNSVLAVNGHLTFSRYMSETEETNDIETVPTIDSVQTDNNTVQLTSPLTHPLDQGRQLTIGSLNTIDGDHPEGATELTLTDTPDVQQGDRIAGMTNVLAGSTRITDVDTDSNTVTLEDGLRHDIPDGTDVVQGSVYTAVEYHEPGATELYLDRVDNIPVGEDVDAYITYRLSGLQSIEGAGLSHGSYRQTQQTTLIDFTEVLPKDRHIECYPLYRSLTEWSDTVTYQPGDAVTDAYGDHYICRSTVQSSTVPPADPWHWRPVRSSDMCRVKPDPNKDGDIVIQMSQLPDSDTVVRVAVIFGRLYIPDGSYVKYVPSSSPPFLRLTLDRQELIKVWTAFRRSVWDFGMDMTTVNDQIPDHATAADMMADPRNQCFVIDLPGTENIYTTVTPQIDYLADSQIIMPAGASGIIRSRDTGRIKNYHPQYFADRTLVHLIPDDMEHVPGCKSGISDPDQNGNTISSHAASFARTTGRPGIGRPLESSGYEIMEIHAP